MRDTTFTAVLAFSVLVGGTAAIGSELLVGRQPARVEAPVLTMPMVTVVGRAAPAAARPEVVVLPQVTVIGRAATPAASTTVARAEGELPDTRVE